MPISTFLHDHQPTYLRGALFLALSEVAVIQAPTVVSDLGGGGSTTWAAVGTTEIRIDPLGGAGRQTGGRIDERSTHVATVPPDVQMRENERVIISGRGTFEVTSVEHRTLASAARFEVLQVT